MANSVIMKFTFQDDTSYNYELGALADEDIVLDDVRERVQAINSSLSAGTSDGLDTFLLSADGSSLKEITEVTIRSVEETILI